MRPVGKLAANSHRGFLANGIPDPRDFVEKDIRRAMPRFNAPHFGRNRKLLDQFNMTHMQGEFAGSLSGGQRKLL